MIRSAFISTLVLSLCLVAGCDKDPKGTTPPDGDGSTASTDGGGKDKGKKDKGKKDKGKDGGGDSGGGEEADPTQTVCPAEVSDYPAPYFGETVLLRLPKGVTEDNFVEMNPGFARISSEVESVSCVEGLPGAMISFMALASFVEEKDKSMTTYRDEMLKAFGYVGAQLSEEQVDEKGRTLMVVIDAPPDPANGKTEPARALMRLKAANGTMYAVAYETHPNAWNAMKNTFTESATRITFLAP